MSLPTPMAGSPGTDSYNAAGNTDYSRRIVELASAVPTPTSALADKGVRTGEGGMAEFQRNKGPDLAAVSALCSPSSRDWKDTPGMATETAGPDGSERTRLDHLPRQAQLAVSGALPTGGSDETAKRARLDPAYSRWLMGYPPEWDAYAPTETRSSRSSRRRSSAP